MRHISDEKQAFLIFRRVDRDCLGASGQQKYEDGIPFISIKASLATCPCQLFLTDLQLGKKKNGSDIPMTAAALTLALQQCVELRSPHLL